MIIRRYQADDWPRLCEIHDLARMDELRSANLVAAFLPLTVAAEREGLFDYEILVAEENGVVLGFVAYSMNELSWLYVIPEHCRKGIGKLLTAAVIKERPGGLTTQVLLGNNAALNFYQSMGFVESGVEHGRMPGNEQFAVSVHCLEYRGQA